MTTEKWTPARNCDHSFLEDGSWIRYEVGLYDERGIMSDCVKPRWSRSGEFQIKIIPPEKDRSTDWEFLVTANKEWGNIIAYNIQQGQFKTIKELEAALRKLGKKFGTYNKICGKESIRVGL